MKSLNIIVAVDQGCGFGKNGTIPWHYPADLKHFRKTTSGHICVMGRNTYEDMYTMLKAKSKRKTTIRTLLPTRESYVVTSSQKNMPGATKVRQLREVMEKIDDKDPREIFILGGYRMFVEALAWTKYIYMTIIPDDYDCDLIFPLKSINSKFTIIDGTQEDDLQFVKYKRVRP